MKSFLLAIIVSATFSCGGAQRPVPTRTYCETMCEYENEYKRVPRPIIVHDWDETHLVVCQCFAGGGATQTIIDKDKKPDL
jgi:hypothetical protein